MDQLVCLEVPPASVYKGVEGEGWPAKEGALRGSPTPTVSRTPFFPSWGRRRGKEEEEGKERGGGAPPPLLVLFGLGRGGARGHLLPPFLFLVSYSYYMEGILVGLGKGESYSRWE